jgi:hypothetical protein
MDALKLTTTLSTSIPESARPTAPIISRQPVNEWKRKDPSSTMLTTRYPRPVFFDYRVRGIGYGQL